MKILLIVFLLSYVMAMLIFILDAVSVVMLLADTHRVYIKKNSIPNPYLLLLLFVPILNVLLGLVAAYSISTDQFMLRVDLLCENMTPEEAKRFDAKPTFNTAMEITRNHNQI